MKKNMKKLILLVMLVSITFTRINSVKAAEASNSSNISSGWSTSPDPGHPKCGYNVLPTNGLIGYRLSVIKLDENGNYSEILKQIDYVYAKDGSKYKGTANIYTSVSSDKCKTRYGLLDDDSNCSTKWQAISGKTYYEKKSKRFPNGSNIKFTDNNYDWSSVAKYYNGIATSYSKTKKYLETIKVPESKYAKNTLSTGVCAISTDTSKIADSYYYKNGKKEDGINPDLSVMTDDGLCRRYTCDTSKSKITLPAGTKTLYFIEKNKEYCVSLVSPTTDTSGNAVCPTGFSYKAGNWSNNCYYKHTTNSIVGSEDSYLPETQTCDYSWQNIRFLWILIEPMYTVQTTCDGKKTYFGTATEIAQLKYDKEDNVIKKYGFKDYADSYFENSKNYLFMDKDTYKLDNTNYSINKLVTKVSTKTSNGKIVAKTDWKCLYKKCDKKIKGIGVGNVWLGKTISGDKVNVCEDKPLTCENNPNVDISNCVKNNMKKGYTATTSKQICELTECSETISCDYCDNDGREEYKTYDNFKSELVTALDKTAKDKRKDVTEDNVINEANRLIDVWKKNNCYSPTYEETKTGGDFTCSNYYRNDKRITVGTSLKEGEKNYVCSTSQINRNGTATGALGKCTIYCTETADLSFPGNVKETIKAGDSFEWPSKSTDNYKMQVDYNITCTAINTSGAKNTSCDYTVDLDNFKSELGIDTASVAKLTYDNVKYSFGSLELDTLSDNIKYQISKDGGKNWNNGTADELYDGYKLKLSASYKYYIPEKLYYYQDDSKIYYNKDDNKAKNTFDNKGVGRLATKAVSSITQDYTKTYDDGLHLDLVLGNNNSIGSVVTNYTCKYNVENPPGPGPCVCPTGTLHEGESLEVLMLCDKDTATCTQNIERYCNLDWPTDLFKSCKCKNCDNKETDLTDCIKQNKGAYEYCYHKQCTEKEKCDSVCYGYEHCKWTPLTPRGNNYYDSYYYCYPTEDDKNNNRIEKAELCDEDTERIYCPERKCENKIIYRTIDLENPFPGQNENGVTTEFSLTNTKGRYPGINWNNSNWVKNKITNAREVRGNEIYNQQPLYTITLTPEIMKEIRDKNKEFKYDAYDNVMKCSDSNTEDCTNGFYVSIVLRNVLDKYNSLSGTCGSLKSVAAIKQCYEDNSSSAYKYTYKN